MQRECLTERVQQIPRKVVTVALRRGIARTADIAGTATAVSDRVSRRHSVRWAAKDQQTAAQKAKIVTG